MKDWVLLGIAIVSLALAICVHVSIAVALARRAPRRALAALLIVPLAPYWAWRDQMPVRAALWMVAVLGCGVAIALQFT